MAHIPNTQTGSLIGNQKGTQDRLTASDGQQLYGDAYSFLDHSRGGNDVLFGCTEALDDITTASSFLCGDAWVLYDYARGGNDKLTGGTAEFAVQNDLYGDAYAMRDYARGGNDELTATAGPVGWEHPNSLYGDAGEMSNNTKGGNDLLTGASAYGAINQLFGDALLMSEALGGNDVLKGGSGLGVYNYLYGDAFEMSDAQGRNDVLNGGDGSIWNYLYGDGFVMDGHAIGGDDKLTGGDNVDWNFLYGDSLRAIAHATCGDDLLIGGTSIDYMWGDAEEVGADVTTGSDTFVLKPGSGFDFVYDFRQADHDKIDVSAYGFHDIVDLAISDLGSDTLIDFGGGNAVTLVGVADPSVITASDFIFA